MRHEGRALAGEIERGAVLFVDTRSRGALADGMVPGALNVPAGSSFVTWASWVVDPEGDDRPIVVLAKDEAEAKLLRDRLSYVGIDRVEGYVTDLEGLEKEPVPTVSPEELDEMEDPFVLDVRAKGEHEAGYIPGAIQLHGGRVMWHLDDLPGDKPIVIHCQTGARAAVVASALRAAGFGPVLELEGSYEGWAARKQRVPA
ncbi:rhodanese-like domain-containing protein [Rubrobacter marinus]|uniref:rhodanese-like domain-containing protein n=1 Tax=Rubrobacter marinus TaxID=2653852 RepID=UPI001A9CE704|nr:rhodanese-like domain-containing protein [Rubrobacter marinus]